MGDDDDAESSLADSEAFDLEFAFNDNPMERTVVDGTSGACAHCTVVDMARRLVASVVVAG